MHCIADINKIAVFNTGRQYSDKGQRIAAVPLFDGRVMFADVDRNIDGITLMDNFTGSNVRAFVMSEYDGGYITYGAWDTTKVYNHDHLAEIMAILKQRANAI